MKNAWKLLVGGIVIGSAILTACGKGGGGGGGGGSTAAAPPASGCSYDASGNCIPISAASGYVGDGRWQARLVVNNLQLWQQFAMESGLCNGYDCSGMSGYFVLTVELNNGGCLPGPANFSMQTYQQGYPGRTVSKRGDAYMNSTSNGFVINYSGANAGGPVPYASGQQYQGYTDPNYGYGGGSYPNPMYQGQSGPLQINATFFDGAHQTVAVQVVYRNTQIAVGTLYGWSRFNAAIGTNPQYCATQGSYGYGGNGGGYYGNGYYGGNGGYRYRPIGYSSYY